MTNVPQRIVDLSPEKREILLRRLKTRKKQQDVLSQGREQEQAPDRGQPCPPLQAYDRSGAVTSHFPLSFAQQRLWFLDQLEPGSTAYLISSVYRTRGRLDVQCFEKSLQELIRRHESLRTTFVVSDTDTQPVQVIHPVGSEQASCPLPVIDLQGLLSKQREVEVQRLADMEHQRPCDLARGPLRRTYLFRLEIQEHVFVLTQHHIITDGWSDGVLVRELRTLYHSFATGQPSPLAPLPIQYADYALWQRQWLQGVVLSTQLTYWEKQLADVSGRGLVPPLQLPTDHVRPAVQTYRGATQELICPPALSEEIRAIGRQENVTLFMVLLAAFQVLLARYTGQSDISVGTPIANRRHAEIEGVIGFFVNTLVMRTDLSGNPTFLQVLQQVREVCLGAYAHQDIPFEKVVETLAQGRGSLVRDLNRSPLFQVMLILQNTPQEEGELAEVSITPLVLPSTITSKFDLTLSVVETAPGLASGGLHCTLEYNTDLFEADTITRMLAHFQTLLEGVIQSPQAHISDLPLLTEAEQEQLLVRWNATQADYLQRMTLSQLFEQQVEQTPDATALVFEDKVLTYAELNRRANKLAHYLHALGVGPEVLVGIALVRSVEMVIALLAVLKAGGAYVPLDPAFPQQRLAHIIQDAPVAVLLTQSHLRERLRAESVTIVAVDMEIEGQENNPANATQPDHLAYMIYTSGSTGRPKGVLATHRATLNRLQWMWATFPFEADEICCQKTSLSFVDSIWEIFGPLLQGIRLVLIAGEILKDAQWLIATLTREQVTRIVLVPSLLRVLLNSAIDLENELPHLKYWTSSGEALSVELALLFESRLPQRALLNLYGSSEVAGDVACYDSIAVPSNGPRKDIDSCRPPTGKVYLPNPKESSGNTPGKGHPYVPIGRPIANTQLYILDTQGQPVPIGVTGELYVAGLGLARGYKNRPDLTAERFIPHPFVGTGHSPVNPGERLYQTGDLARYRADGTIEYLGRIDSQIKLRGFRIELGEIEATLRAHPAVQEAVIVLREEGEDNKYLVAYVAPVASPLEAHAGSSLEPSQMQEYLHERLPDYMVPTFVVFLETLPLTPNGKVDRKALPIVDSTQRREHKTAVAPSTALQELLAGIWKEVLHLREIGIHDNFFALGGHSLLAIQVIGRIRQTFELNLPLRNLFEAPTIARLSQRLEQVMYEAPSTLAPNQRLRPMERPVDLPLSFAQERLWFLNQWEAESAWYNVPMAFRLSDSTLHVRILEHCLAVVVQRHEALRTTIAEHGGRPVQVIAPTLSIQMPVIDLRGLAPAERDQQVSKLQRLEASRSFDLVNDPLLRIRLLRLGAGQAQGTVPTTPQEHVLLFTMHHIVTDGWSAGVLIHEMTTIYQAEMNGQPASALPPLPIQYADYTIFQRSFLQGEVLDAQVAYWRKQLADLSPLVLPTDHARPAVKTERGASQSRLLPKAVLEDLLHLCQKLDVTLFMLLLGTFQAMLMRYSKQTDISVGTPVANRTQPELEGMIGFFVNTLVMRTDLSGNPTFLQLLRRVREVCLGAYAHQDIPFEKVVEELAPERDMSRSPLFQVMLILQNTPIEQADLAGVSITPLTVETTTSKFDLTLSLTEVALGGLECVLEYSTDLFEASTITHMLTHFQTLLEGVLRNPQANLSDLPLLTEAEREQLLVLGTGPTVEWTGRAIGTRGASGLPLACPPRQDLCIHQFFEQQVEQTPDSVALVFESETLTYAELNRRANQLAHYLHALGVGPEIIVGIYMERSIEMVVGLLSVLKAGGAYVPLDPNYPQERLTFLLEDAQVSVVLIQEESLRNPMGLVGSGLAPNHRFPSTIKTVCVACESFNSQQVLENDNPHVPVQPENIAYLIYTSGSTGRPKGVMGTHRASLNRFQWMWQTYPFSQEDVCCQKTNLSFVDAVWEIFGPLLQGVPLVIVADEGVKDPFRLRILLERHAITRIVLVPSLLRVLLEDEKDLQTQLRRLTYWVSSGEPLALDLAQRFARSLPAQTLINLYGSSEVTADVTCYEVGSCDQKSSVPIGRPIANTQVYLLDSALQLVPIGIPGEVYIGGANLTRGYWQRADLTAERFLPHPFALPHPSVGTGLAPVRAGARLYHTGDLARALPDGTLEFLGRVDQQVKIRGHRIEPAEIEAALLKHPAIREAVVLARDTVAEGRDKHLASTTSQLAPVATQLVAYLVGKPEQRGETRSQRLSYNRTKELEFSLFYFANDAGEDGPASTSTSRKRYKLLLEGAKFADSHNFTAVWTPERHFHPFGGLYPNPSVTSAAIAAVTQKVQIRAGSVVLPLHDPLRVAEEWAVVDNLSDGRVGISFATGWIPNDFVLAPEHYTKRKELMTEKIETFRKLWRGEAIALPAPMGNTVPIKIYPQPIQPDVPIWLTSSGNPETFRQAGEMGMNLLTHLLGQSIDELAEKIALYRQARQEHGHSGAGHVTLMLHTFIGTESAAVREKVRQPFSSYLRSSVGLIGTLARSLGYNSDLKNVTEDDLEVILAHAFDRYYETSGLMGTVSTCLPMVEQLKEIGVDEVACLIDFGVDEDEVLASLHELAKLKEEANKKHTIPLTGTLPLTGTFETTVQGEILLQEKVPVSGTIPTAPAIRSYLQEQLPSYMVPTFFVRLDALPLLPNGKVDRKALPVPDRSQFSESTEMTLPQTPLQEQLALIWTELLHLPQVGIHDNFFALGGHSLLAMQVIARIRGLAQGKIPVSGTIPLGVDLPLRSLFEHPTIAQFSSHLEKLIGGAPSPLVPALVPVERGMDQPLSFAQERLWFLNQWEPGSAWYNVPMAFRLSGPLHVEALERSLARVIQRHEVLRTTFEERAGIPFQVIAPNVPIQVPVIDLHNLTTAERDQQVTQLARTEGQQPFDLANGPLLRIRLLKLTPTAPIPPTTVTVGTGHSPVPTVPQEHVLLLTLHHIVSDITSTRLLATEMVTLYHTEINDKPSTVGTGHSPVRAPTSPTPLTSPTLPELPIQYADYALWQRQWLQGEVLNAQIAYWKRQLAGIPAQLKLPTDRPRPAIQATNGARVSRLLPLELQQQLKALSQREGVTLFMTGLAAFNVLLYCYTGQDDLVVGTDVTNRNQIETEHLIGFFVNQVVLRTDLTGNPRFLEVMHRVRKVSLEAYAHQDLPFDRLVKALNPERNLSHTPLFQVKFIFQNAAVRQLPTEQTARPQETLKMEPLEFDPGTSQLDLLLNMSESDDGLSLWLEYPTDLFNAETMTRFLQQFEQIIRQIVTLPESRLESIQQAFATAEREEHARREQELQQVSLQKLGQLRRHRNVKKPGLN
jgi:natural product biosynthesis luciferase-like monooxygenase protein/amino acid adenylation domain-containing protein